MPSVAFFCMAGSCLFSGGFALGLAWTIRGPDRLLNGRLVGFAGVCLAAGVHQPHRGSVGMIALPLSYRGASSSSIARPGTRFDPRVGVPVSASLPRRRQAVGRGARVPAYLFFLPHLERSSPVHSKCTGEHPRCRTTIPSVRKTFRGQKADADHRRLTLAARDRRATTGRGHSEGCDYSRGKSNERISAEGEASKLWSCRRYLAARSSADRRRRDGRHPRRSRPAGARASDGNSASSGAGSTP